MKRFLLFACLLLAFALPARAQNLTTTSATVVDSAGTAYTFGTYTASLVNNTGQPALFGGNANFQKSYQGGLDTNGFFSVVLPSVTVMTPTGMQWSFFICANPQTVAYLFPKPALPCFSYTSTGTQVSGASVDLSSSMTAVAALVPKTLTTSGNGGALGGTFAGAPTYSIASSPTGATQAGNGVVTITTTTTCTLSAGQYVTVAGVTSANYNGTWAVITGCGGGSTFTYFDPFGLSASGNGTVTGLPTLSAGLAKGGPTILYNAEGSQNPPIGAVQYGINNVNPTFPDLPTTSAMISPSIFSQYCRKFPDAGGRFGCGWHIERWQGGDGGEVFVESLYHPTFELTNVAPTVNIVSVSRAANVVTVTTSTGHQIRPVNGDVNISGVTGCATSPNGHWFGASAPTATSSTTYTFPQSGGNETCTPSTGLSVAASRASFLFLHNDSSNNITSAWQMMNDDLGDRSDRFALLQKPNDATNVAARFRVATVPTILNTLGVGQGAANDQVLIDGNNRTQGMVTSQGAYNDTTGGASFNLRNFAGTTDRYVSLGGNDFAFNTARQVTGNGLWRFDMSGGGLLYTSASDGGAAVALQPVNGLTLPANKTFQINEGASPGTSSGAAVCYADSTAHALFCSYNNGTQFKVPTVGITNTWTAAQTFNSGNMILAGATSGTTILNANAAAGSTTATLPANTGILAELNLAQSFTATQTFAAGSGNPDIKVNNAMVAGNAPTCSSTGSTSPTCTVTTGSTNTAGTIQITVGTSPAATGTVTLTFSGNFGTNPPVCLMVPSQLAVGQWNARATIFDKTPAIGSDLQNWDNNAVALTASTAIDINYHCWAK